MSTNDTRVRIRPASSVLRIIRLLALLALAGGVVAIAARTVATAQSPNGWRAGQSFLEPVARASGEADRQRGRAVALGRALHLSGSPTAGERRRDVRDGTVFDEIEFLEPDGSRTADVRLDPATGAARFIVRFDRPAVAGPAIDAAEAPARALAWARAAGIPLPASPPDRTSWDAGLDSWEVVWDRVVGGVAVPGDGVTLGVFPNGDFSGLSVFEAPLASVPAHPIGADAATSAALRWASDHGITAMKGFAMLPPVLRWEHPNGFADPLRGDAPDPTARLAYAVTMRYLPIGSDSPTEVELYVDAADGSIVGGAATA